jgi:hypothetical protein
MTAVVCWEDTTHICGKYTMIVVILKSELTEYGPHPLSISLYDQFQYKPPLSTHIRTCTSSKKDFRFRFPDHNCNSVTPSGFYFILNSRSKIKNVLSCFTIRHRIPPQNTVFLFYASEVSKIEEKILVCIKKVDVYIIWKQNTARC